MKCSTNFGHKKKRKKKKSPKKYVSIDLDHSDVNNYIVSHQPQVTLERVVIPEEIHSPTPEIVISTSPEPEIVISDDDDENLREKESPETEVFNGCEKSPEVNVEPSEIISDEFYNGEDIVVIPSNSKNKNPKTKSNGNWWKTPVKGEKWL